MIEALEQAVFLKGLPLLVLAVTLAGIVRGFAGFGTAMVFIPLAALVVEPVWAILMLLVFDLLGPIALLPRAWRDGEPRDVGLLGIGALIGLPFGIYLLLRMDPVVFRWIVSLLALFMLVLLASGWRYQEPLDRFKTCLVGVAGGFLCGIAALPGPPVILSYLSSPRPASAIRANNMLYLYLVDAMTIAMFAFKGLLVLVPALVGALLSVPYTIGGLIGQRIFNPEKEHIYRRVAYAIIASSAIAGLPVWSEEY